MLSSASSSAGRNTASSISSIGLQRPRGSLYAPLTVQFESALNILISRAWSSQGLVFSQQSASEMPSLPNTVSLSSKRMISIFNSGFATISVSIWSQIKLSPRPSACASLNHELWCPCL
ncbi:hypothetical protein BDV95DRAFT_568238 [Massariosphaeria phaeospora]|uniref:Uncharacterized protein n=1 Tax=Massariosphaeria phaeospora TaxID=100035 RepID=A0A7C8MMM1_9PLEO|nr:hypothetical protein BDV95DRAFT_568238 [Massariosphaeria phaeospora]